MVSIAKGICSIATSNASTGADILKRIWFLPIPTTAKVAIAITTAIIISIAESE